MTAPATHRAIGIIGLGEAGSAIATGLRVQAAVPVHGFDEQQASARIAARAEAAGVVLADSLADLAGKCTVLIAMTNASSAVSIAREVTSSLRPEHVYADWNSASPATKQLVADAVAGSGALFVDGAIMAAVPSHGHRVPVLISGSGCAEMIERTSGSGLSLEAVGTAPGQAAAAKMLRSLLTKGLESLVLECVLAAEHYGVTDHVLQSMHGTPDTSDWESAAGYMLGRMMSHGRRRAAELDEVAETLEAAGVAPLLAKASARRLRWLESRSPATSYDAAALTPAELVRLIGQDRRSEVLADE